MMKTTRRHPASRAAAAAAHPRPRRRREPDGFALVLTLLILSVLAIVAVSFLSSMTAERSTANAFANRTRADQAARAGADSAMAILKGAFQSYPDSATVWDTTQTTNADGTPPNEGTTLFLRAKANSAGDAPDPSLGVDNRPPATIGAADPRLTFVLPLVSGASPKLWSNKSATFTSLTGATVADQNFVDLNRARFSGDTQGWIGSPPGTGLKRVRAPWVELKSPPPSDPNTTDTSKFITTGRYAYWVEDESFRTNVNYASLGDPGNLHFRSDNNKNLVAGPTFNDLVAPLLALNDNTIDSKSDAKNIYDTRAFFPLNIFPEALGYAHADGQNTILADKQTVAEHLRYLVTTQSGGLNVSRHGGQRLNLNNVNVVNPNTSPTDTNTMQAEVDRLVQAIRFHAPNFGERFYRNTTATDSTTLNAFQVGTNVENSALHRDIYVYKIVANIRDNLDADSQPTMIKPDGSIYVSNPRQPIIAFGHDGPNVVAAMGKEAVPYLQESGIRFRGTVTGAINSRRYSLTVDHYVEFWNMTDRTLVASDPPSPRDPNDTKVYLGGDAFVRIAAQAGWLADNTVTGNTSTFPELTSDDATNPTPPIEELTDRDYNISLATALRGSTSISGPVKFDPGVATVITTDPDWVMGGAVANPANCFYCPTLIGPAGPPALSGKRLYTGPMPKNNTGQEATVIKIHFRSTGSSDYKTEVVLGNGNGYLECFQGPMPIFNNNTGITFSINGSTPSYFFAGSLLGNATTPSQLGDPRTNNEPLEYILYNSGSTGQPDQCHYFNETTPSTITLGNPNTYLIPTTSYAWPDYWTFPLSGGAKSNADATNAPMVVANGPLTSIGQLGDVFDPARVLGTVGSAPPGGTRDIKFSRGGGRTLKIGQHDDRYNGTTTSNGISNSTGWAAWRLTDFFSTSDSVFLPGLVNINGVARDNGAALRAALRGFKFQPLTSGDPMIHGDAKLTAKSLDPDDPGNSAGLQNLIDSIVKLRLTNTDATKPGPFFERGEISETPILNPALILPPLVSGVSFSQVFDRGREELVRRLSEMITTRGDVFTVYSVGQSISQSNASDPKTKVITGTVQLKITFQLLPKNSDGSDFNPGAQQLTFAHTDTAATLTAVNKRFAMPHHYDVVLLSSK